jgi:hypothetical protein
MNLPSVIVLVTILVGIAFSIKKLVTSKGACGDCKSSCVVKR